MTLQTLTQARAYQARVFNTEGARVFIVCQNNGTFQVTTKKAAIRFRQAGLTVLTPENNVKL